MIRRLSANREGKEAYILLQVQLNAYIGLDGDIADECPKTTRQVKKKLRPCGRHPIPGLILAAWPDRFVRQKCPPFFWKR